MRTHRPALALDPRRFGRRAVLAVPAPAILPNNWVSDDLRLFALTFAAGFLFVSIVIA